MEEFFEKEGSIYHVFSKRVCKVKYNDDIFYQDYQSEGIYIITIRRSAGGKRKNDCIIKHNHKDGIIDDFNAKILIKEQEKNWYITKMNYFEKLKPNILYASWIHDQQYVTCFKVNGNRDGITRIFKKEESIFWILLNTEERDLCNNEYGISFPYQVNLEIILTKSINKILFHCLYVEINPLIKVSCNVAV